MGIELCQCGKCGIWRPRNEMTATWGVLRVDVLEKYTKCRFCTHDEYFFSIAQYRCRTIWGIYSAFAPQDLIDIETALAKIRYVLMGKDPEFVTHKHEEMITQVNNSADMRQALNENLHALLTKKRKLLVVKEVNNTLGKILADVKMELMQNALVGSKDTISWFDNPSKKIRITYQDFERSMVDNGSLKTAIHE